MDPRPVFASCHGVEDSRDHLDAPRQPGTIERLNPLIDRERHPAKALLDLRGMHQADLRAKAMHQFAQPGDRNASWNRIHLHASCYMQECDGVYLLADLQSQWKIENGGGAERIRHDLFVFSFALCRSSEARSSEPLASVSVGGFGVY